MSDKFNVMKICGRGHYARKCVTRFSKRSGTGHEYLSH